MSYPLISVIIPMYNAEEYIVRCIQSVIKQTYKNIEVYIIDDKSKDNSAEVCSEIIKTDARFTLITNKINSGVSKSRNIALEKIKGKYVVFIDSDDCVSETYIEELYNVCLKNPEMLSICSFADFTNKIQTDDSDARYKIILKKYYLGNPYAYHPQVWGCLFDSFIIRKYQIYFEENSKFGEDAYFLTKYMTQCKGAVISSRKLYYYYINPNGGAVRKNPKDFSKRDVEHRASSLTAYKDAVKFAHQYSKNDEKYILCGYCFLAANILLMMERADCKLDILEEELKRILKFSNRMRFSLINRNFKHFLLVNGILINRKLICRILDHNN